MKRATWADFTYKGAFKLPRNTDEFGGKFTGSHGGMGITNDGKLLIAGSNNDQLKYTVVEIPELVMGDDLSTMNVATVLQDFVDVESNVDIPFKKNRMCNMYQHPNGDIYGCMLWNYDASNNDHHFLWRNKDGVLDGLHPIPGGYKACLWISEVPPELINELGCTHIMSGAHNYSIVGRASRGTTAFGVNFVEGLPVLHRTFMDYDFNGGQSLYASKYPELVTEHGSNYMHYNHVQVKDPTMPLGAPNNLSYDQLDQYPQIIIDAVAEFEAKESLTSKEKKVLNNWKDNLAQYPTKESLGILGNDIWIINTTVGYGFIVPGTRTFAVFGGTAGREHGSAYRIRDNNGKQWPGPAPYVNDDCSQMLWTYDIDHWLNDEIEPHQVIPEYEQFTIPAIPNPTKNDKIRNGTFDKATNRLYLAISGQDSSQPIIVVYDVNVGEVEVPPQPTMRDDLHAAIDEVLDKYGVE